MKILTLVLRILFGLLLLMPAAGALGLLPEPTAEMYTPEGWAFMEALMTTPYMMPLIGITSLIVGVLFLAGKNALAAILLAPFTVNVILFHIFLDAAPISAAAIPAYILVALNLYFLWVERKKYHSLF